jgi:hypothetical protein
MPFSANLNTPGAKTGVPAHRSVPVSVDGGCPTQDLLHSPGDNGEAITHFRSNSASDEAEEQQVIGRGSTEECCLIENLRGDLGSGNNSTWTS